MKVHKIYLILLFASLTLSACKTNQSSKQDENKGVTVEVKSATAISNSRQLSVSGNVEGNKTVRLGFLVAGKVDYIAASEGEPIKKGELLSSLDPESYQIAVEMADAQLSQMNDDFKRIKELYDRNSITQSDYVKITNGRRSAQAQYDLQIKNLNDTKLYSPINGILLKKGIETGEIVDEGIQLFAVSDIYTVKISADIPEMQLHLLNIGDKAKVYIAALDSTFEGTIIEMGALADPATRTFTTKIKGKNPNLLIRPGMTAELKIQTTQKQSTLSLPIEAILHDLDNAAYVYVADTSKQKAYKRIVSLGKIIGNNIEITSGLSLGEKVVVSGTQKIANGTSIIIK